MSASRRKLWERAAVHEVAKAETVQLAAESQLRSGVPTSQPAHLPVNVWAGRKWGPPPLGHEI